MLICTPAPTVLATDTTMIPPGNESNCVGVVPVARFETAPVTTCPLPWKNASGVSPPSSDALAAVESILRNSLLASSILRKFAFALSLFRKRGQLVLEGGQRRVELLDHDPVQPGTGRNRDLLEEVRRRRRRRRGPSSLRDPASSAKNAIDTPTLAAARRNLM